MTKTRTVFRWVKRFLFVGRMETKKLERAILDKFETITEIVQRIPLKTIPGKLLLQTDMKERDASLPWPLVGFSLVLLSIFSDQYFESLQGWAIGEGGPCCWALLRGLGVPRQDLPTGWGLQVPTLRHPLASEHLKIIFTIYMAQS